MSLLTFHTSLVVIDCLDASKEASLGGIHILTNSL